MNNHERWRKKQHKILWKSIGKRKVRRRFKNVNKEYVNQMDKKIVYYDYLD